MAVFSIFGDSPPSGVTTNNGDTSAVNLATGFYLFNGVTDWTAAAARFWLPADSTAPTTGYKGYLWQGSNFATATQLASVDFNTATAGAWNTASFSTPVPLTAGTYYWVSIYYPGGGYPSKPSVFGSALQSSGTPNLYGAAHTEVSPGNGSFLYGAAGGNSGASTNGSAVWYGADILVADPAGGGGGTSPGDAVGITDSVLAQRTGLAASVNFSGSASDPLGGTSNDTLTVPVDAGASTLHTVKHTMYETAIIFGSAITQDVKGPNLVTNTEPIEVGVAFTLDRPVRMTGLKVWKHPDAAGSIPFTVWSPAGSALSTTTLTWVADGGGWRTITLPSVLELAAGTEYKVSYFAANAKYGANDWVFNAQDFVEPPFRVKIGGACIKQGGSPGYPAQGWHASFWIHPMVEYDTDVPAAAPGYMNQWTNYTATNEFPFAVFYSDPPWLSDYVSIGVKTFVGIPIGVPGYREAIIASGAEVWANAGQFAEGALVTLSDPELAPYIKGYFLHDEPDLAFTYVKPQFIRDQIATLRRIDPSRPHMLNWGYGLAMASGFSFLQIGQTLPEAAAEWIEICQMPDILSLDYYNFMPAAIQGNLGAWTYPRFITRLEKFSYETKPVWGYVETTSPYPDIPTPAQFEAAVWGQIIAGAQGIVFFDHRFANASVTWDFAAMLHDVNLRPRVQQVIARVRAIGGLLDGEKGYVSSVSSSNTTAGPMGGTYGVPISTRSVSDASNRYILAQASRPGTTTGTFTVPSAANKTITVVDENRTLTANGSGVFTDTFTSDYAFHLYRWVP